MTIKHIFVTEDDKDIRELLLTLLKMEGFQATALKCGEECLAKLHEKEATIPDLILLDMIMPGLSGIQVKIALNTDARLAKIPVVFMSADNAIEEKLNGSIHTQNASFLKKPVDIDKVVEASRFLQSRVNHSLPGRYVQAA